MAPHIAYPHVAPMGFAVIGFDFSGCGESEGEWVTLGWKEPSDLHSVLLHAKEVLGFKTFGLLFPAVNSPYMFVILSQSYGDTVWEL